MAASHVELDMSTKKTSPKPQQPLTSADFEEGGRYAHDVIGEFDGPSTRLFIVSSDEYDVVSPKVVEIDRHTHCVFFSRTQITDIHRYIEIALQNSPIESEVDMRTVGVVSQLAISAFYSFVN